MTDTLTPAEVFPPGEFLRDELDERGWAIAEFAEIIGRPVQAISEIINGRKSITAETAAEIGHALGTSAALWLNLQTAYQLHTLDTDRHSLRDVDRRARLRSLVPIAEIKRLGWIPNDCSLDECEQAVADLLGMDDLDGPFAFAAAARRSNHDEGLTPAQRAWLGQVRQLGEIPAVAALDLDGVGDIGKELARRFLQPNDFRAIVGDLAAVGVALAVVPALQGSKIDGAALRCRGRAIVGLSLRGKRFDGLVFTLAHELAHIHLGHLSNQSAMLDENLTGNSDDPDARNPIEVEADQRASSWLFPAEPQLTPPISKAEVIAVAHQIGCHPALVVGRLQWSGLLPWTHRLGLVPSISPDDLGL